MRMSAPLQYWLVDHIPFFSILLLQILALMPLRVPLYMDLSFGLAFAGLFFWLVARPDLLSPAQVFLLGLSADCLCSGVFGVQTLCYMLLACLIYTQRHLLIGRSFGCLWAVLAVVMLVALLVEWGLSSLFAWYVFPWKFFLLRWLYVVGCYPIITGLFGYCYDRFLDEAI